LVVTVEHDDMTLPNRKVVLVYDHLNDLALFSLQMVIYANTSFP